MRYKDIYRLVHKNREYPTIQFTPHIRALDDPSLPDPFMYGKLIAVSEINFENKISFIFDLNGFEKYNNTISEKTFPQNVCTITISLFSHYGESAIDFFNILKNPISDSNQSLNSQLRQLIVIAEMFELHEAANYLRSICK